MEPSALITDVGGGAGLFLLEVSMPPKHHFNVYVQWFENDGKYDLKTPAGLEDCTQYHPTDEIGAQMKCSHANRDLALSNCLFTIRWVEP